MMSEEAKRQARVVDQMLSMHSALRDRYARRAKLLMLAILGCSAVLCTITFLPDDALKLLGVSATANRFIIGGFASLVFFLSILELCVRWQVTSAQHAEAAEKLAKLKLQYRDALTGDEVDSGTSNMLTEEFERCMEKLPPIPDKLFPTLKSYHLRKVRLSQMIDSNAGCPLWFLRLRLLLEGVFGKKEREGADQ